jgi:hypothetical protein
VEIQQTPDPRTAQAIGSRGQEWCLIHAKMLVRRSFWRQEWAEHS